MVRPAPLVVEAGHFGGEAADPSPPSVIGADYWGEGANGVRHLTPTPARPNPLPPPPTALSPLPPPPTALFSPPSVCPSPPLYITSPIRPLPLPPPRTTLSPHLSVLSPPPHPPSFL